MTLNVWRYSNTNSIFSTKKLKSIPSECALFGQLTQRYQTMGWGELKIHSFLEKIKVTVPSFHKSSMKTNVVVCPEYYEGFLTNCCLCSSLDRDRVMSPDIEAAHALVREQKASLPHI